MIALRKRNNQFLVSTQWMTSMASACRRSSTHALRASQSFRIWNFSRPIQRHQTVTMKKRWNRPLRTQRRPNRWRCSLRPQTSLSAPKLRQSTRPEPRVSKQSALPTRALLPFGRVTMLKTDNIALVGSHRSRMQPPQSHVQTPGSTMDLTMAKCRC